MNKYVYYLSDNFEKLKFLLSIKICFTNTWFWKLTIEEKRFPKKSRRSIQNSPPNQKKNSPQAGNLRFLLSEMPLKFVEINM